MKQLVIYENILRLQSVEKWHLNRKAQENNHQAGEEIRSRRLREQNTEEESHSSIGIFINVSRAFLSMGHRSR